MTDIDGCDEEWNKPITDKDRLEALAGTVKVFCKMDLQVAKWIGHEGLRVMSRSILDEIPKLDIAGLRKALDLRDAYKLAFNEEIQERVRAYLNKN